MRLALATGCYEAYTPNYNMCFGYVEAGYTCTFNAETGYTEWCAYDGSQGCLASCSEFGRRVGRRGRRVAAAPRPPRG